MAVISEKKKQIFDFYMQHMKKAIRQMCLHPGDAHFYCPGRSSTPYVPRTTADIFGAILPPRAIIPVSICYSNMGGNQGQVVALREHCVHTAHAEAGILTQEYLSLDWLHSKATKPT